MNKIEKVPFARRAHAPVKDVKPEVLAGKYAKRVRHGKTEKDHKSGAWNNRFGHREARAAWTNDNKASNATWPLGAPQPY